MKVILLTSDYHISANIAIKAFLKNPLLKKHDIDVAGLICVSQFDFGKRGFKIIQQFIRQSGLVFFLKNVITNIFKKIIIKIAKLVFPDGKREYFSLRELAGANNIPFLKVDDINSSKSKDFIKSCKPDYVTSCFLLQIVDKEVLNIPKKGAINVHPALIQRNRGTFTSFWTLLKNWKNSGATVHFMTEKPDDGRVILQKRFFVHPSDTIFSVNKKSAMLGGNLLAKSLIKLKKNKARAFFFKKIGHMFTMPTTEDVKRFYGQGRRLIRIREFFQI